MTELYIFLWTNSKAGECIETRT